MTDEERKANLVKIIEDPETFKRESFEAAKRENPHLTDEQIEAGWEIVARQFGL